MITWLNLNCKNILSFSNPKINCLLVLFKYLPPPNGICTKAWLSEVECTDVGEGLHCTLPPSHQLELLLDTFPLPANTTSPLFSHYFLNCLSFSDQLPWLLSLTQDLLWVPLISQQFGSAPELLLAAYTTNPSSAQHPRELRNQNPLPLGCMGEDLSIPHTNTYTHGTFS